MGGARCSLGLLVTIPIVCSMEYVTWDPVQARGLSKIRAAEGPTLDR